MPCISSLIGVLGGPLACCELPEVYRNWSGSPHNSFKLKDTSSLGAYLVAWLGPVPAIPPAHISPTIPPALRARHWQSSGFTLVQVCTPVFLHVACLCEPRIFLRFFRVSGQFAYSPQGHSQLPNFGTECSDVWCWSPLHFYMLWSAAASLFYLDGTTKYVFMQSSLWLYHIIMEFQIVHEYSILLAFYQRR